MTNDLPSPEVYCENNPKIALSEIVPIMKLLIRSMIPAIDLLIGASFKIKAIGGVDPLQVELLFHPFAQRRVCLCV